MLFMSDNECIEWETAKKKNTYGYCSINGKVAMIHRVVAEAYAGRKLSRHEFVCHKCDNKACFNPTHIYIGTGKTNAEDRKRSGKAKNGSHLPDIGERISKGKKGYKHTEQAKLNMSLARKKKYREGYISTNKGGAKEANSGSFAVGKDAPNKGRKRVMIDGKMRFIKQLRHMPQGT